MLIDGVYYQFNDNSRFGQQIVDKLRPSKMLSNLKIPSPISLWLITLICPSILSLFFFPFFQGRCQCDGILCMGNIGQFWMGHWLHCPFWINLYWLPKWAEEISKTLSRMGQSFPQEIITNNGWEIILLQVFYYVCRSNKLASSNNYVIKTIVPINLPQY